MGQLLRWALRDPLLRWALRDQLNLLVQQDRRFRLGPVVQPVREGLVVHQLVLLDP